MKAYVYIPQDGRESRIFITKIEANEHVEVFAIRNDIKGLAWVPSDSAMSL